VIGLLLNQSIQADAIHVYVSYSEYLLDKGIARDNEILVKISEHPPVQVRWCPNIGPYRNFWQYLKDARARGLCSHAGRAPLRSVKSEVRMP
jgi:hypothetical protein